MGVKKIWGLKKNGHDKKNGGTGCQNTRKFPVFVSPWGGGVQKRLRLKRSRCKTSDFITLLSKILINKITITIT